MKELLIIFAIRLLEGIGLGVGCAIALTFYNSIHDKIKGDKHGND